MKRSWEGQEQRLSISYWKRNCGAPTSASISICNTASRVVTTTSHFLPLPSIQSMSRAYSPYESGQLQGIRNKKMESTRKKSCTGCRHAKARCNLISPTCSRCARRNLSCIYPPGHTRQGSAIASPSQKSLAAWPSDDGNQVDTLGSGDSSAMACRNGSLLSDRARWNEQMTDNEFEEMLRGCGMLNWTNSLRFPSEQGEISSLLEEQSGVESASGMSGLSHLYDWSTPNTQVVPEQDPVKAKRDQDVARALQQSSNFQLVGWRVLRGISDAHPNILSRKMAGSVDEIMGGNYVWSCLSEYPTQFGKETLPPFIHLSTMRKDTEDLPETLANCKLIVKMYEGKTNGTRYLVHKTLMQEVQRLRDEVSGMQPKLKAGINGNSFLGMMARI